MSVERPLSPFPQMPGGPGALINLPSEAFSGGNTQMTDDGGALVTLGKPEPLTGAAVPHDANLAEYMSENDLAVLASDLINDFEADVRSRKDWEKTYMKGLDLLGLKFENRTEPWDGACGVFHPLLTEAVVRFQAQTIQEVFPASGPCKTKVVGEKTTERVKQSQRVEEYMNYLTTEEMVEYRPETERLLFALPIAGSAFRKVYHDPNLGRACALYVPAEDFVVNYGATDLSTCGRATYIMKRSANWVRKLQVSGFYRDIDLPEPQPDLSEINKKRDKLTGESINLDTDDRHTLLEMLVEYDLKGFSDPDGIALPYVITIDKDSRTVLGIRRNWREDDPLKTRRDHFVHYQYLPGLGFYGFGLVHMIGGLAQSATSLLRQLVDAGTLANLPGGLKTRGLRIKGDDTPIAPGEFRDVDVPSGAIRDNIQFLPYKEPSTVLYQLLGDIVQAGRQFASAADVKASDLNGEAPVGTTLAILEREMKVMSAVQARIHAAMGKELRLLAGLVRDHGLQQYPYEVEGEFTPAQDFDQRVDIIPVSDPNAGTMAQRIMQYQAALQLAATGPQMYDLPLLHRQMLEVLGISEADKIVPTDDDLKPTDPVTENMSIITGKPVKAFLYQDHEAHLQVHLSMAQHPKVMELMQQNPQAQAVQAAGAAHIAEHLAMAYRQQIEKELGVELPDPEQPLPDDIELRLSRLVAPAAAQLTGKAQQQAQAEENAKKQEDPIIQMQMKELEIKEKQVEQRGQETMARVLADLQKTQEKLQLEREKLQQQGTIEAGKIATKLADIYMDAELQGLQLESDEQAEGFRIGLDFANKLLDREMKKQQMRSKTNG